MHSFGIWVKVFDVVCIPISPLRESSFLASCRVLISSTLLDSRIVSDSLPFRVFSHREIPVAVVFPEPMAEPVSW